MGKKKEKKKNIGLYIAGSLALAVGAMIVMPKVIDYVADQLNTDVKPKDDDDWGPEIVRREKPVKEDENGEL